jgi:UDP-3-O-[3-hydroxymyristoyl] glucosamine N-acyltransferase
MVSGSPAFEHKQWLRAVNAFSKLPDLARTVRNLAQKRNRDDSPENEG